jgi:hypothetical protein
MDPSELSWLDDQADQFPDEYRAYQAYKGMARQSNILDPIKDNLDPEVFQNPGADMPKVHPRIVHWVKRHVYKVLTDAGYPDPSKYLRLILTGSLTTYQWSHVSDFDVSLWVDVKNFPDWQRADMIALMVEKLDGTTVPHTTHPLQCFVVNSKLVKMDDLYRPGLRSAFDLDKQQWIVMPEKGRMLDVYKAYPALIQYAKIIEDKMRMLIRYDPPLAKEFWHQIHKKRQRDQAASKGDYAESNIAYKWLANAGLFPQIAESTGEYIAKKSMAQPLNPQQIPELQKHVEDLAQRYGIDINYVPYGSNNIGAQYGDISISPIVTDYDYLTALHEIGHIAANQINRGDAVALPHDRATERWQWSDEHQPELSSDEHQMEHEAAAWQWAMGNSKISVTPDMMNDLRGDIKTYHDYATNPWNEAGPYYTQEEVPGYPRTGPSWQELHA